MKRLGQAYLVPISLVLLSFGLFIRAAEAQSLPEVPDPGPPVCVMNCGDGGETDSSSDSSSSDSWTSSSDSSSDAGYAPSFPQHEVTTPQPSVEEALRRQQLQQANDLNSDAVRLFDG